MSDKRMELEAVYQEWKTTTPEGRAFFESPYNLMVFYQDGVRKFSSVTVENLTLAYRILSRIYDFTRDARPVKSIAPDAPAVGASAQAPATPAAEPEYSEATDPNFPQRGPHEPGHIFQGRVNFYRESRLKRIWMEKENARLRNAPHHADTIRRTRGEQAMIEAQKDWYTAKRAAQTFGKKSPQ